MPRDRPFASAMLGRFGGLTVERCVWFLTKDERYRLKALNGFMSNFSKAEKDGKTYACYNLDYIPGGGFATDCKKTVLKIRQGKPKRADSGLSRYVWVRASETVLITDWL